MAGTGKDIGMHAHNNLQLAFANTIEAIILGANRVDATMGGLGRGAGNCPMELLLGFLRNPKFRLRPVIELLQNHIEPLKATLNWGPSVPYNITGQMNLHPRAAIQFLASDEKRELRQVLRPGGESTPDRGAGSQGSISHGISPSPDSCLLIPSSETDLCPTQCASELDSGRAEWAQSVVAGPLSCQRNGCSAPGGCRRDWTRSSLNARRSVP